MQSQSNNPINTFTIGFNDKNYDESYYANKIAKHLGTNHNQWIVEPTDVFSMIPSLSEIYDEPFADSSQIPTTLISKLIASGMPNIDTLYRSTFVPAQILDSNNEYGVIESGKLADLTVLKWSTNPKPLIDVSGNVKHSEYYDSIFTIKDGIILNQDL